MGKKKDTALLIGGGILAFFGWRILSGAAQKFTNGLSYKFKGLRLKRSGVNLVLTGNLEITNKNAFGVKVDGFAGKLRYGSNGQEILPITLTAFDLAPKATSVAPFQSQVSFFSLAANITSLVTAIADGQLKKLWISGTLRTNIVSIPVETEVSILSE